MQAPDGFDVTDSKIAQQIEPGDLVVLYQVTIQERLTLRNFMLSMRGNKVEVGGPQPLNHSGRQEFAKQLNKFMAIRKRQVFPAAHVGQLPFYRFT